MTDKKLIAREPTPKMIEAMRKTGGKIRISMLEANRAFRAAWDAAFLAPPLNDEGMEERATKLFTALKHCVLGGGYLHEGEALFAIKQALITSTAGTTEENDDGLPTAEDVRGILSTPPQDPATPQQADREAAWPFRPSCYKDDETTKSMWTRGKYDHCSIIQAFLTHRLTGYREGIAACKRGENDE